MIQCPTARALRGNGRFHAEHHLTPSVALPWIKECVLLNESISRPGQLQQIMRTDLYYVVFCVRIALFHFHYLHLVLIQVQVPRYFSLIEPPVYSMYFLSIKIDFDRPAHWYTCFINGFTVYFGFCEIIMSRFIFLFSRGLLYTQQQGCSYGDKWKKQISRKSYLKIYPKIMTVIILPCIFSNCQCTYP